MIKLISLTALFFTMWIAKVDAVILEVPIPKSVTPEEYVSELIKEYPIPNDINYEIYDGSLYLVGDGQKSELWAGLSKTEDDRKAEEDLIKTLGVSAVIAMGYGAYKTLKK